MAESEDKHICNTELAYRIPYVYSKFTKLQLLPCVDALVTITPGNMSICYRPSGWWPDPIFFQYISQPSTLKETIWRKKGSLFNFTIKVLCPKISWICSISGAFSNNRWRITAVEMTSISSGKDKLVMVTSIVCTLLQLYTRAKALFWWFSREITSDVRDRHR